MSCRSVSQRDSGHCSGYHAVPRNNPGCCWFVLDVCGTGEAARTKLERTSTNAKTDEEIRMITFSQLIKIANFLRTAVPRCHLRRDSQNFGRCDSTALKNS